MKQVLEKSEKVKRKDRTTKSQKHQKMTDASLKKHCKDKKKAETQYTEAKC